MRAVRPYSSTIWALIGGLFLGYLFYSHYRAMFDPAQYVQLPPEARVLNVKPDYWGGATVTFQLPPTKTSPEWMQWIWERNIAPVRTELERTSPGFAHVVSEKNARRLVNGRESREIQYLDNSTFQYTFWPEK